MEEPAQRYFETLTKLIQTSADRITLKRTDFNPKRSVYEIHGNLGRFQIRIKEIHTQSGRMYSYYVLLENRVFVGFDNYPDIQMLNSTGQSAVGKNSADSQRNIMKSDCSHRQA